MKTGEVLKNILLDLHYGAKAEAVQEKNLATFAGVFLLLKSKA